MCLIPRKPGWILRNLPVTEEGGSVGNQLGVEEVPEKSEKEKRENSVLC